MVKQIEKLMINDFSFSVSIAKLKMSFYLNQYIEKALKNWQFCFALNSLNEDLVVKFTSLYVCVRGHA